MSKQFLAVDIGNNQIKLGAFLSDSPIGLPRPDRVLAVAASETTFDRLAEWLPPNDVAWSVATVHRGVEQRLATWVQHSRSRDTYHRLDSADLPINVRVESPEQVGADRLLAAIAVNQIREAGRAAIVVDAGSAITVDLVSGDGTFEGGVILPGFQMTARALAEGTDLLPLVDDALVVDAPPVVGKSTVAAIRSGLFWGGVGAVRELVERLAQGASPNPQLFIAGGDAGRLAPYLDDDVRVVSDLVLSGIAIAHQNTRR